MTLRGHSSGLQMPSKKCTVKLFLKSTHKMISLIKQFFRPLNFLQQQKTMSFYLTAKSLQSCPTLCNPIDGRPPGFAAPGILQARTLEWVAISFSNA